MKLMGKKKINKNENEWKGILQETQSNISTESVTSTGVKTYEEKYLDLQEHLSTNLDKPFIWGTPGSSDYNVADLTKKWKEFAKDKTLSGEEKYCNVEINKDWNLTHKFFTKEQEEKLKEIVHENWVKENVNYKQEKRIEFEFTPSIFWQLIPSVAINLRMKEVEFVWLCFGMYINWK